MVIDQQMIISLALIWWVTALIYSSYRRRSTLFLFLLIPIWRWLHFRTLWYKDRRRTHHNLSAFVFVDCSHRILSRLKVLNLHEKFWTDKHSHCMFHSKRWCCLLRERLFFDELKGVESLRRFCWGCICLWGVEFQPRSLCFVMKLKSI